MFCIPLPGLYECVVWTFSKKSLVGSGEIAATAKAVILPDVLNAREIELLSNR